VLFGLCCLGCVVWIESGISDLFEAIICSL